MRQTSLTIAIDEYGQLLGYDVEMKRKWDVSRSEMRKKCVEEVITRIEEQGDDQFGMIAAEEIIDIVLENLGPDIYNSALDATKKVVKQKVDDLDVEIDLLQQQS